MRIIILGPTASGKTSLSIRLAEKLKAPIISADSRQCYKYLDVGTAKPSPAELQKTKHYNISVLDLTEKDSAMSFQRRSAKLEEELLKKYDYVIYAGGSTLHLQSLIQPFNEMPEANAANIKRLEQRARQAGLQSLYGMLAEIDPEYVQKMDGMNRQRIIRALDVWMQTGNTFSSYHQQTELTPDADTLVFGLEVPRHLLYQRINDRVDNMMKQGLAEETQSILDKGYGKELQALNTVGYKEMIQYLEGELTLPQAISKIKTNTRRYAKRQTTWFARWNFIHWLPAGTATTEELCGMILAQIKNAEG